MLEDVELAESIDANVSAGSEDMNSSGSSTVVSPISCMSYSERRVRDVVRSELVKLSLQSVTTRNTIMSSSCADRSSKQ